MGGKAGRSGAPSKRSQQPKRVRRVPPPPLHPRWGCLPAAQPQPGSVRAAPPGTPHPPPLAHTVAAPTLGSSASSGSTLRAWSMVSSPLLPAPCAWWCWPPPPASSCCASAVSHSRLAYSGVRDSWAPGVSSVPCTGSAEGWCGWVRVEGVGGGRAERLLLRQCRAEVHEDSRGARGQALQPAQRAARRITSACRAPAAHPPRTCKRAVPSPRKRSAQQAASSCARHAGPRLSRLLRNAGRSCCRASASAASAALELLSASPPLLLHSSDTTHGTRAWSRPVCEYVCLCMPGVDHMRMHWGRMEAWGVLACVTACRHACIHARAIQVHARTRTLGCCRAAAFEIVRPHLAGRGGCWPHWAAPAASPAGCGHPGWWPGSRAAACCCRRCCRPPQGRAAVDAAAAGGGQAPARWRAPPRPAHTPACRGVRAAA